MAARTYNAKLCNSIPKYIEIRSLDEIKTIIPRAENSINIGISKRASLDSIKKFFDIIMQAALPKIIKYLKNCMKDESCKKRFINCYSASLGQNI